MAHAKKYTPAVAMVAVQAGNAGLNILSKLALDSGMSPYVMIAYRQIIGTLALAPFAFFIECMLLVEWGRIVASISAIRHLLLSFPATCLLIVSLQLKSTWKSNALAVSFISRKLVLNLLVKSYFKYLSAPLLGRATLNELLYFIGLKYTTPMIASALTNILPAVTFIMTVPFRVETADLKSSSGKAKIVGTTFCVSGSMLMTFYNGVLIHIPPSSLHWRYAEEVVGKSTEAVESNKEMFGAILVVGSCITWAIWLILEAKMSKSFSAPYMTSTIMSVMSSIQCFLIGGVVERNLQSWSLGCNIRLICILYMGLIGSGFAELLTTWAIEKRGPLFVSMFSPLELIIVAVLGWVILDEKLYLGSVLGSVIIVAGLYLVNWANAREIKLEASNEEVIVESEQNEEGESDQDIEGELPMRSTVNINSA